MSNNSRNNQTGHSRDYETTGLLGFLLKIPWLKRRYIAWIDRILPREQSITLDRNKIFIFPNARGFLMVLSALCIFIAGTNYGNNLVLAFGFLLISIFVVGIWHCFNNLLGLNISSSGADSVFVGDTAQFRLNLKRPTHKHFLSINLFWDASLKSYFNVDNGSTTHTEVAIVASQRGYFYPPRLRIETFYPFGITRAWSHLSLDTFCVVYPKPIKNDVYLNKALDGNSGDQYEYSKSDMQDEFFGLKNFQEGEKLSHIYWKAMSKGQGLLSKQFIDFKNEDLCLQWNAFDSLAHETKASYLCYWLLQFHKENRIFSLELPGTTIKAGQGDQHLKRCLIALATFDSQDNPDHSYEV